MGIPTSTPRGGEDQREALAESEKRANENQYREENNDDKIVEIPPAKEDHPIGQDLRRPALDALAVGPRPRCGADHGSRPDVPRPGAPRRQLRYGPRSQSGATPCALAASVP